MTKAIREFSMSVAGICTGETKEVFQNNLIIEDMTEPPKKYTNKITNITINGNNSIGKTATYDTATYDTATYDTATYDTPPGVMGLVKAPKSSSQRASPHRIGKNRNFPLYSPPIRMEEDIKNDVIGKATEMTSPANKDLKKTGRRTGCHISEWQKELQKETKENKELFAFNECYDNFLNTLKGMINEVFLLYFPNKPEPTRYILKQVCLNQVTKPCHFVSVLENNGNPHECILGYDLFIRYTRHIFFPEKLELIQSMAKEINKNISGKQWHNSNKIKKKILDYMVCQNIVDLKPVFESNSNY